MRYSKNYYILNKPRTSQDIYKIYTKPMNTKFFYEITQDDINILSLQAILDFHNVGKIQSMMVSSKSNIIEIRIIWKNSYTYKTLEREGLHQYLHVKIPETNIWIYKKEL